MTTTVSQTANRDLLARLWVTASFAFCVLGTLYGFGVIGTRVEESSGGALAADATLLAPGRPAFSIWSVIYLGLLAYTIWQWLPRANTERVRATRWLAGASMILNATWLLVTQVGWIALSVLVIIALAVVLGFMVKRLSAERARDLADAVVVDGTFGLYVGWASIATAANIAAAGKSSGVTAGDADPLIASLVLLAAAGIGVLLAWQFGGRLAVAGAMAWGIAWIAVARLTDAPASTLTGVTAILAALIVVGAAVAVRLRRTHAVTA